MLFADAFAQEAAGSLSEGGMGLIPFILIFVVFYFLMIRPQQKRLKQHQQMIEAISRGDRVVTGGGIIGTVSKVEDSLVHLTIAKGVDVEVSRSTISEVINRSAAEKPEPKPAKTKSAKAKTTSKKKG